MNFGNTAHMVSFSIPKSTKSIGRTPNRNRNAIRVAAAAAAVVTLISPELGLAGTNGTYTNLTPGGLWSVPSNWNAGVVANGQDGIADFSTLSLTANNLVHLDTARTIGQINFGDQAANFNWTLDNNGNSNNILTLSTSTAVPVINVVNQNATISASLGGTQGFTKTGAGVLTLTGVSNYTGVTTIANGTLVLGAPAVALGAPAAGASVYLDPQNSTVTTTGGVVTGVSDLSGNGNNASNTGAAGAVTLSTINGHKAFFFNGGSTLTDSTFSAAGNPETVFAVINPTTVGGPASIVGSSANGGLELRLYQSKLQMLRQSQAGYTQSTSNVPSGALSIVALSYNTSGGTYYLNGTAVGATGSGNPGLNAGTLVIGGRGAGESFSGSIGTVLIYNSVLSAADIATTESFLAQEYASTASTLGTTQVNLSTSASNLALGSGAQSISSLAGVANSNVYLGGGTLTVGGDGTSTLFAGNISDTGTGAIGTGGQLAKVGAGTLTLSGSISNTGGTSVAAGTLLVSGAYSTSGPTSVTGGTLSITGNDSATGSNSVTGGTYSISGVNSTTGPFTIGTGGILSLSGASTATGAVNVNTGGTLALIANAGNITGTGAAAMSSAIGAPSAFNLANNLGTSTIQLRGDSSVTFANSDPTGGTGGYPNGTIINFDVNNLGGTSTASNQTLTLGNTSSGVAGFATYVTTINVTGGNGYTVAIPTITEGYNTPLNLNASTASLSIGSITDAGKITVGGASNTTLGPITSTTPANGSNGALTKTGVGRLTLTGSNTYPGATNISAGTLALTSTAALTTTPSISINSGATFDITANPAFALASSSTILSGSGTINGSYNHSVGILSPGFGTTVGTLNVNGTLSLTGGVVSFVISGSNNSTGGIYNDLINVNGPLNLVGASTLSLAPVSPTLPSGTTWTLITYTGSAPTGSGSLNVSTSAFSVITVPGAIELKYNSGIVGGDIWTGNVNGNWDTATPNFYAAGTTSPISFTNGDNATFNDNSAVTAVNLVGTLTPSSVVVNSNVSNYTFAGTGSIGGLASLLKQGSSTLTVSTANNYTGGTNVAGGTIFVTNTTGAALGTGVLTIGTGAIVQVGDGGADGSLANSSIVDNGSFNYNRSDGMSFNSISGTGSVTMSGTGLLGLAYPAIGATNNYSGGTTIAAGVVYAFGPTSFGTGPVNVLPGGNFYSFNNTTFANSFTLNGNAIQAGGATTTTITGPVVLGSATSVLVDGSANLNFSGGISNSSSASLTMTGPGTTTLLGSNSYTGGTFVNSGRLVFANTNAFPKNTNLTVGSTTPATAVLTNHGLNPVSVLQVNTLSLAGGTGAWTGTLDLTNNAMIVQNSSNGAIGTVFNQLQQGYNNGAWQGTAGIVSSAAGADSTHLTALGVIINDTVANTGPGTGVAIYSTIEGAATKVGDILVKYTYYGDANLNGQVDGSDYSLIDNGYVNHLTGWYNGDFNYDGVVDGSDYTLMDNAFNTQGAQFTAQVASATSQIAGVNSAVPEPASLTLLGVGAVGLLSRRVRRQPSIKRR